MLIPFVPTFEKAVGLRAVGEGANVGSKIPEHVFASRYILERVTD